jgi:hypothetical protein
MIRYPLKKLPILNLKKQLISKYGDNANTNGFYNQCIFVGGIIQSLRDSGYKVTTARKYSNAIKVIESSSFDLAIIDLGWYMDTSLPEKDRPSAGWMLCEEIDEKDVQRGKNTPQILFSSRFPKEPELSRIAAQRKKLPIFKEATDVVKNSLMAAVGFVESAMPGNSSTRNASDNSFNTELQHIALDTFREPIRDNRRWTLFTLIFVYISLCTLICGILLAFFKQVEIGIITTVASIISGIISSVLYKRLNTIQKTLETTRKEVLSQLEKRP